mmetsp:Transcript_3659/g.5638  ORF Transcript_3659/g.5638 Transcript_3659/m.5638 type:complete len:217 (+) Transcript_3659:74-724(+)
MQQEIKANGTLNAACKESQSNSLPPVSESATLIQALPWQIIFDCYLQKDDILSSRATCRVMEARSYDISLNVCVQMLLGIHNEDKVHPAWHKFNARGHPILMQCCGDDETLIRGWLLSSSEAEGAECSIQEATTASASIKEVVRSFTSSYFYRMLQFARVSKCFPQELLVFGNDQRMKQHVGRYGVTQEDMRPLTDPLSNLSCPVCHMESSLRCRY